MSKARALAHLRTLALAAALSPAGAARAHAVTVSPTAVFIDARSPTATLSLYNNGTSPEEVEISFGFGYPSSNADGVLQVQIQDSAAAGEPSVVPWLRAFPRRMQLQPGQRQTLRVMVQAPAGVADGEYWGRVMVRSRGGQPPIESTQGQVHVAVNVETVVATAVLFRKGAVSTGVNVRAATGALAGDSVRLTLDLDRTGNAVYLGRIQARLRDAGGRVLATDEDALALYRSLRRRFTMALPAGAPRAGLSVEYVVDTERPDLPPAGPLKAPPVTGTVAVR
jgi:P pilus assembly chaperone PapD